jgi:hypothetical protein
MSNHSTLSKKSTLRVLIIKTIANFQFQWERYQRNIDLRISKLIIMEGIRIVTDSKGKRTGLYIDLKALKNNKTSGRSVAAYLQTLDDIEDLVDIQQVQSESSEDWEVVKTRLKQNGTLKSDV